MPTAQSAARRLGAKNLVGFKVGEVTYALDLQRVREIIRPLPFITLPQLPPAVQGVSDHRGDVVPVIDLRVRFGLSPLGERQQGRWIVVACGPRLVALVVDRVTEVFGGVASQEREVPDVGEGQKRTGITTAYRYGGGLVFVVDVDVLTAASEELDLSVAKNLLEEMAANDTR